MNVKQVIVMRKDLKMRRGKEIAQGAHASTAWLSRLVRANQGQLANLTLAQQAWITSSFTKVCVRVESEEQLQDVARRAREAGLTVHVIVDAGKTEFDGVPTTTCLAIGPDESEKIDLITGDLQLY